MRMYFVGISRGVTERPGVIASLPVQVDQKALTAGEEGSGQAESSAGSQDWRELQSLASTFSGAPRCGSFHMYSLVLPSPM